MNVNPIADEIALEAAERVEVLRTAEFKGGAPQRKARIQCLIREAIDRATVRQAAAYKMGLDAAKAAAYQMEQNAAKLYSQCGPESLEAERATNERLTNEVERLEAQLDGLRAAGKELRNAVECNYPEVKRLSGEDARDTLVAFCEMVLNTLEKSNESPRPD